MTIPHREEYTRILWVSAISDWTCRRNSVPGLDGSSHRFRIWEEHTHKRKYHVGSCAGCAAICSGAYEMDDFSVRDYRFECLWCALRLCNGHLEWGCIPENPQHSVSDADARISNV